jgi:hypothetical protein
MLIIGQEREREREDCAHATVFPNLAMKTAHRVPISVNINALTPCNETERREEKQSGLDQPRAECVYPGRRAIEKRKESPGGINKQG